MGRIELEEQPHSVTVDEETKALLEQARESARTGKVYSPEESRIYAREKFKAWQKQQEAAKRAA